MVSDEKGPSLDQHTILVEFIDVFPKEFHGLPLEIELDFTIKIKSNLEQISKTPYRMTNLEFCESCRCS